jgi:hypothetical protein
MAKKTLTNPHGLHEIYARRQPRRPHYLRQWMERRHIESQADLAEAIDADKSVVSRWLDEHAPTTPGIEWQQKLGAFFGTEEDPADIFRHPDDDWFSRLVQHNSQERIEQAKKILQAAGITPNGDLPKKASGRT